jgi:hypothetical protein
MESISDLLAEKWEREIADITSGRVKSVGGDYRRFECPECFNSGWRYISDPQGSTERGVVRCDRCRYWEFHSIRDMAA